VSVAEELRIQPIEAVPLNLQTHCDWIWREWGHELFPTYEHMLAEWRAGFGRDSLPQMLSATRGGAAVGVVGLAQEDFAGRPDLSPWLVALYVHPDHRGEGIGSALVRACEAEAARRHIETLYLCTDSAAGLYRGLGWRYHGAGEHQGHPLEIYSRDLRAAHPSFFT
jgi:GNAT superfamily N-acetyltransferase